MNLQTHVAPGAPAKCNQPRCIKIVKWFLSQTLHSRASILSNLTVRLSALRAWPKLRVLDDSCKWCPRNEDEARSPKHQGRNALTQSLSRARGLLYARAVIIFWRAN